MMLAEVMVQTDDVRYFALLPIAVVGLLVLGGIVLTVILLANRKTRVAGVVLLAIGMLAVVGVGSSVVWLRAAGYENHREQARAHVEFQRSTARMLELDRAPRDNETIASRTQKVSATEEISTKKSGNVLLAMGRALGKAISDTRKEEVIAGSPEVDTSPSEDAGETGRDPPAAETAIIEPATPTDEDDSPPQPDRPAWVGVPSQRTPDGYQMSVTVGPYATRQECDRALPAALQLAAADYVETCLGPKAARRVRLSLAYIRDRIVKQTWEETVHVTLAPNRIVLDADETSPMIQFHLLLEFGPEVKTEVEKRWQRAIVTGRLWYTGVAATGVLALLAVLFGGLKIDQSTGGSCRGRLSVAAVAAAVVLAAACFLVFSRLLPVYAGGPPPAAEIAIPAPSVSHTESAPVAGLAEVPGELSPEDRAAAEKQRICPVTDNRLGSMGKPLKLTVQGREVFLCCKECRSKFMEGPDKYLAKLNQ